MCWCIVLLQICGTLFFFGYYGKEGLQNFIHIPLELCHEKCGATGPSSIYSTPCINFCCVLGSGRQHVSKVFSDLYDRSDETCLNPSQDTEHELCCHNSGEKPIQKLIVEIGCTSERLFITEYFCMGESSELCGCKNGHHGRQCLGIVSELNFFGLNLISSEYLGIYIVSVHTMVDVSSCQQYTKLCVIFCTTITHMACWVKMTPDTAYKFL